MSRYTYTLNPANNKPEQRNTYKRSQLERMTTYQLREICRTERLVTSSVAPLDREGFIRLILRFRGQKEYPHIIDACEGGMERLQQFMDTYSIEVSDCSDIYLPGRLVFYADMAMDEEDGSFVKSDSVDLYESNLLLVDEDNRIYTCLYLKEADGYWLCKSKYLPVLPLSKHRFSILYFPKEAISAYICDHYYGRDTFLPGNLSAVRIPLLDVELREAEENSFPLVIDFGSCNTTMGICLPDGTRQTARLGNSTVIPTVIGVSGIQGDQIQYVFGKEAMRLGQLNYQDQDVPVFYDMKRWVSDSERREGMILENGVRILILRREMLKAYLEYIVELARKQFKSDFRQIEMLAPVRQKEKFQEVFQNMLPGIEIQCSLDEGIAVLFHNIDRMIQAGTYEQDRWYHALLIDCGGGTSDLTSGRFRIHSSRISYDIDLCTSYENGDTNFGGNNLTYRILQMLKIEICRQVAADLPQFPGKNPEETYEWAEQILPTQFAAYADSGRENYFFVKNNYYYLFELAEQVKKYFFQSGFRYELEIGTEPSRWRNPEQALFLDRWRLSIRQHGTLKRLHQELSFACYLHQVEELLRPDIYQLMERFLRHKFDSNELSEYQMIQLTGQSCKSRLFEEALKEYVPGIYIQRSPKETEEAELKMCCLYGALSYFYHCKQGIMHVNQSDQVGALPYEIQANTHEGHSKILVKSLDKDGQVGYISRFMIGRQLDLELLDTCGRRLKTCYLICDRTNFVRTTQEEINIEYSNAVIQAETDSIQDGEMKFFVWVSRNRWGFLVLPVLREKNLLYKGEETFFAFEDDTWEVNFFNGRK